MCNMKSVKKAISTLGFVVVMAALAVAISHAYATDNANLEQQFNAAFEAMLNNPADVKLTTHYAELAVEMGDYESAIPPLERLLMSDPEQLDVKLEVGVLYFLLNSHGMAKEYLGGVKGSAKATGEQIKRAEEYLARM